MNRIADYLNKKSILLLGFGREGQSSYHFIRKYLKNNPICIADKNIHLDKSSFADEHLDFVLGDNYLDNINDFDIVLKSPGISLKDRILSIDSNKISSQTDLFLQAYSSQCIGVTGTKGKSTTSTLIFHILSQLDNNVVFGGNIGIPLFELIDKIDPTTKIVLELSSHQLEFIHKAPKISLLLNLFEEHLDHYNSYLDYQKAKFNIAKYQSKDDFFICNGQDKNIDNLLKTIPIDSKILKFGKGRTSNLYSFVDQQQIFLNNNGQDILIKRIDEQFPLKGEHNFMNVAAAVAAISCLHDIDLKQISAQLDSFHPLKHRLEPLGIFDEIIFYNDSISTIPQASIAAVEALKNVDTLILGGMDRGINYQPLADYFTHGKVQHFIFVGQAGKRMMQLFENKGIKELFFCDTYPEIVALAKKITQKGKICLLSPAAPSYDMFKNFEARGDFFRTLVENKQL